VTGLLSGADIATARERIAARVHRTPTMSASTIGEMLGLRLYLKAELFQKTGSFKVRGVFNKLLTLSSDDSRRGLVSLSAGNHAAALAYGATAVGARATIVMPRNAVRSKIEATRAYGGEVVLTDGPLIDVVHDLIASRRLTLIHPFDDLAIMAGQGTVGLELLQDVPDLDAVIVPVGGGGLISGIAAAVKAARPTVRVVGVEPTGADGVTRGLAAGHPVTLDRTATIADGLTAPFAGEHTLRHIRQLVDDIVLVDDEDIVSALRLIVQRCKLAAEPSAAAPLAALLSEAVSLPGASVVACVVSGGNVDLDTLKRIL
jgi:threonine dehydratase